MKNVLIVYFSGSGSTKTIAEILGKILSKKLDVTVERIRKNYDYNKIREYDLLILGYPTYFFRPPLAMIEFVQNIPEAKEHRLIFIFATCGATSGNSFKILKSILERKNYEICGFVEIKGPASEFVLTPLGFSKSLQRYEPKIYEKLRGFEEAIYETLETGKCKKFFIKQRFFFPSFLSDLLSRLAISFLSKRLYIDESICVNCNKCVELCYHECFKPDIPIPKLNTKNCELCFGCIHNCPTGAIKLTKKAKYAAKFDEKFYKKLKGEILSYFGR